MKILVIAHRLPYPPNVGLRLRLYNLYSRLAQNHSVTWVSPIVAEDETYVEDVLQFCDEVFPLPGDAPFELPTQGWRNLFMRAVAHLHWERLFVFLFGRGLVRNFDWMHGTAERRAFVQQVADSARWDIVMCETISTIELVPSVAAAPRVASLHDITWTVVRRLGRLGPRTWEDRLFHFLEVLRTGWYEKRHYRRFDAAITVSDFDKKALKRLCPRLETFSVDNGTDTSYFRPNSDRDMGNTLAFVGTFGYEPNRDGARYFAERILPRIRASVPDARLVLVGEMAPAELAMVPGVSLTGEVPDVRPYLEQASVVVVPLRAGSGTRIKILDALAAGKAVVTTSIGMEGLRVEHGRHVLIADSPEDFAEAVVRLLRNPALRAEMGANGRKLVEQEYDWGMLARRFEDVLSGIVNEYKAAHSSSRGRGPHVD